MYLSALSKNLLTGREKSARDYLSAQSNFEAFPTIDPSTSSFQSSFWDVCSQSWFDISISNLKLTVVTAAAAFFPAAIYFLFFQSKQMRAVEIFISVVFYAWLSFLISPIIGLWRLNLWLFHPSNFPKVAQTWTRMFVLIPAGYLSLSIKLSILSTRS